MRTRLQRPCAEALYPCGCTWGLHDAARLNAFASTTERGPSLEPPSLSPTLSTPLWGGAPQQRYPRPHSVRRWQSAGWWCGLEWRAHPPRCAVFVRASAGRDLRSPCSRRNIISGSRKAVLLRRPEKCQGIDARRALCGAWRSGQLPRASVRELSAQCDGERRAADRPHGPRSHRPA